MRAAAPRLGVVLIVGLVVAACGTDATEPSDDDRVGSTSTAVTFRATDPPAPTPTTVAPDVTSTAASQDMEDVEDFLDRLGRAFATGDASYLLETLHPSTRMLYGVERCAAFLAQVTPVALVPALESAEATRLDLVYDGHRIVVAAGWQVAIDDEGSILPAGIVVARDAGGRMGWLSDCGRVLLTVDPGGLEIVTVESDEVSPSFDAPDSWRIEAAASSSCEVILHDLESGTSESVGSGDASFLIQLGGGGRFRLEAVGCTRVTAIANSAET